MNVQLETPQSRSLSGARRVDDDASLPARNLIEPAGARPLTVPLIHPPQRTSDANFVSAVTIPPLGLAYLAGSLESAGHRVDVLDAIGEELDHVFYWKGRPRDPRLGAKEIETFVNKYGAHDFQFEDLTAITRKDWVPASCNDFLRRGRRATEFALPEWAYE